MTRLVVYLSLLTALLSLPLSSFAQVSVTVSPIATPAVDINPPMLHIDYNLAYPGMLPDNLLYKVKVLRDKIANYFITDPEKKVNFYLLQADKGILSTGMLVEKNKIDLAGSTALKAENNMTLLIQEIKHIPTKPNPVFFDKLSKASLKHQEVLSSIIKKLPKDKQTTFTTVLNFSKSNLETIHKIGEKDARTWNNWDSI